MYIRVVLLMMPMQGGEVSAYIWTHLSVTPGVLLELLLHVCLVRSRGSLWLIGPCALL